MKNRIFAAFISLIVLSATTDLWFSHKGKITFFTDLKPATEVTLQYRKKPESNLISVKKKIKTDGKVSFSIKGRTLFYFKMNVPEKTKIQKIQFKGWKKQNITLNGQNEYTGEILNNRISIDFYNLIVLGGLGYYFGWFLVHCLKYGFPKDNPELPKMQNIEFLRVVFTLFVVFRHFGGGLKIWNEAWIAVEFFFILSGFLLAYTFNSERTVLSFLKSKLIRFLPLIIFVYLVRSVFALKTYIPVSVTDFFSDLFFLRGLYFYSSGGFVRVNWYINALFWASLFYFYLIKSCEEKTVKLWTGIIVFISYSSLCSYGWWKNSPYTFVGWAMLRALGGMGLGYFLKQIHEQLKMKPSLLYNIFEGAILIYACLSMVVQEMAPKSFIIYVICFAVLIFCFIQKSGKVSQFFDKPVFAKMGRYCLAVYLTQAIVVFDVFVYALRKYPDVLKENVSLTVIITLLLSVLLGVIVHHTVELPVTRALNKRLK